MTNLEIVDPRNVPAAVQATRDSVVVVDYDTVTTAVAMADQVFTSTDDDNVKKLADAVNALAGTLTEIIRGLHHGKITVYKYPSSGAHLED